ncbi:MAG: family 10 glycosylhydrolase [Abditibacteriales bacterium]|nr:family 10 glycosylhydrolase [Abditibacteriales bacterium]MDW8367599.1 family 10 glycosylhydrolase [Abditibacteriales bacterium]
MKVQNWPDDVLRDGALRQPWLDWRRNNITAVVKAVSERVRAIKPQVKISAAVFRNWSTDRDTVGAGLETLVRAGLPRFRLPDGLHRKRPPV